MKKILAPLIIFTGIICGLFIGSQLLSRGPLLPVLQNELIPSPSVSPTLAPTPGLPVRLEIPAIKVSAAIQSVGLDADRRMAVPDGWWNIGWYEYGPRPGEVGQAVLAGHYDSTTGPAVFWDLHKLKPGDGIRIVDNAGRTYLFSVTRTAVYPDSSFPVQEVFGPSSLHSLNLITCNGIWDKTNRNYSDRLVIYSTLTANGL